MTAAILVLQTLTGKGCSARCGTQQKSSRTLIGSGPDSVAHTLKTKHGVVNVEGQHGQTMYAVTGCCGRPTGYCASFADAFFQNLTLQDFTVTQYRADVLWCIALAYAAVNTHLLEQIGHAKGARLVSHNGHQPRPQVGVFEQVAQNSNKGHGGTHFFAVCLDCKVGIRRNFWHADLFTLGFAARHAASQTGTLVEQIKHFRAILRRLVKAQALCLFVAQGQIKTIAKFQQVLGIEFFLAVRGHLALSCASHAIPFLGMRQDHHRLALMLHRCSIGRMNFDQVMPTAF